MNSEIQKNVQSSQQISWIFDTQNVLLWLGVLYFAVILLNRPAERAGVRDMKLILRFRGPLHCVIHAYL